MGRWVRTRWRGAAVVCVAVAGVIAFALSFVMPLGPRAGVILDAPMAGSAWRVGLTRGVMCYRREAPPLLGGQKLAWEPTLRGSDSFGPWHRDVSWWRITWDARSRPASVSEARVPAWPAAAVLAGLAAWVVRGWIVDGRRRRSGACRGCGFPLAGPVCSECGRPRDPITGP